MEGGLGWQVEGTHVDFAWENIFHSLLTANRNIVGFLRLTEAMGFVYKICISKQSTEGAMSRTRDLAIKSDAFPTELPVLSSKLRGNTGLVIGKTCTPLFSKFVYRQDYLCSPTMFVFSYQWQSASIYVICQNCQRYASFCRIHFVKLNDLFEVPSLYIQYTNYIV